MLKGTSDLQTSETSKSDRLSDTKHISKDVTSSFSDAHSSADEFPESSKSLSFESLSSSHSSDGEDSENNPGLVKQKQPIVYKRDGFIIVHDNENSQPDHDPEAAKYFHGHTLINFHTAKFSETQQQEIQKFQVNLQLCLWVLDPKEATRQREKLSNDAPKELKLKDLQTLEKIITSSINTTQAISQLNQNLQAFDFNSKISKDHEGKSNKLKQAFDKFSSQLQTLLKKDTLQNRNLVGASVKTLLNLLTPKIKNHQDLALLEDLDNKSFLKEEITDEILSFIVDNLRPVTAFIEKETQVKIDRVKRLIESKKSAGINILAEERELENLKKILKSLNPLQGDHHQKIQSLRETIRRRKDSLEKTDDELDKAIYRAHLAKDMKNLKDLYIEYHKLISDIKNKVQSIKKNKASASASLERLSNHHRAILSAPNKEDQPWYFEDLDKDIVNPRYKEVFVRVILKEQDKALYLSTWSSKNEHGETPLKNRLPKRIITANCMLSGSLEGETKDGAKFQLIDHNLDVQLTHKGSGSHVNTIHHDTQWAPYEISMFVQFERQLEFINALYQKQKKPVIHYHLPGPSYMLSALRFVLSGDLQFSEIVNYLLAVRKRAHAHRYVINQLAQNANIEVVVESPLNNVGDMYSFIRENLGPLCLPADLEETATVTDIKETEEKFVNKLLQALRDNNIGGYHQKAWARILPNNIEAAKRTPQWRAKLPSTLQELIHLANSMEFGIASMACGEAKKDFQVMSIHSIDESPIAKNCKGINGKINLVEEFGHLFAIFEQPRELYDGGVKSNNPYRMDLATANSIREAFKVEIFDECHPSATLREMIQTDDITEYQPSTPLSLGKKSNSDSNLLSHLDSPARNRAQSSPTSISPHSTLFNVQETELVEHDPNSESKTQQSVHPADFKG